MKKGVINGCLHTIYDFDEAMRHSDDMNIAIEEDGKVYPIISKTNTYKTNGVVIDGCLATYINADEDQSKYELQNMKVIDFSNTKSMQEQIEKTSELMSMEETILINPDNIFNIRIKPNDLPEMVALKDAVNRKHIDINKYAYRFGDNFNNDRRLFEKDTITLAKMKTIAEALDMDCYIIFEDREPGVPNPIGTQIKAKITNIGEAEDE
jgi:hypothetical protein|nr:MAG TPA: hypothetical protein [Caudoviricetes sp.]